MVTSREICLPVSTGTAAGLWVPAAGPCSKLGTLVDTIMHGHIVGDERVPRIDVHVVDVDAEAG